MASFPYLGDFPVGATIYIPFSSYDGATGASEAITGLAVTDIEIYKNGSVTQRASDSGYTLLDTDGIDFDAIVGINAFSIDTADNATAGFFTAGADYWVVVSSITADAQTVNFIAAVFSIENRRVAGELIRTTIATLASQTSFTLTAGSADNDAYNNCAVVVSDIASGVQKCIGFVLDYTGSTKTITLAADPAIFTMAAGDNITITATSALANVHAVRGDIQSAIDAKDFYDAGYDPATNKVQGVVLADTLTTYTGNTPQTGDSFARLGAPAGASVSADIAAIEAQTDDIGVAGAGLTALGDTRIANLDAAITTRLAPTVAARTLDVTATGAAGVDWANVESQATVVNLSATNIDVDQVVASVSGSVGSVTGAVGSVTAGVTLAAAAVQAIWDALTSALITVGSIGKRLADNIDAAISSRLATAGYTAPPTAAANADAVWDELRADHPTAATFGQGAASVQGAVTGSVASVTAAVTIAAGQLRVIKNASFAAFQFLLVSSTDHATPVTGATVTATRSIDGAAFAACANPVTEIASGLYKIDLAASDLNGNMITLRFAATGADARIISVITQP
jgi:hypothetical protein